MRIWSIHPKYLDAKGIVALWRETLLAQKVLLGKTRGYKRHPQLIRFRESKNPIAFIGAYLRQVHLDSERRGYRFDANKIIESVIRSKIKVTRGQVAFEWGHFLSKAKGRDPNLFQKFRNQKFPDVHPCFKIVPGGREPWEKG